MRVENFVGKTLGELAKRTGIFWNPVHVFVLDDDNDTTGKRLMDGYSIRQIVLAHPELADAKVFIGYNFLNDIILRVRG